MKPTDLLNAPRSDPFDVDGVSLPFGWDDLADAWRAWRCNCGPSALAAACGITLDEAHAAIPTFDARGYTSPGMMRDALARLGRGVKVETMGYGNPPATRWPRCGLVRIQWGGPWTITGANPRWAYAYTHWVASFAAEAADLIFDVNSGLTTRELWAAEVPPAITAEIRRATGEWWATHIWHVAAQTKGAAHGTK